MILRDGSEITKDNGSVKFGRDGMAEYLWTLTMDGTGESSGDVESSYGWFCLLGKRIVRTDDQGAVWVEKYANATEAREAFETLAAQHADSFNDATCDACGTHFDSSEGACWCCGARQWSERAL